MGPSIRARITTASLISLVASVLVQVAPATASAAVDWAFQTQSVLYAAGASQPGNSKDQFSGDFDDDGTLDVAAVVYDRLAVFEQSSGGGSLETTPTREVTLPGTYRPTFGHAVGDWDGDGDTDLALGDSDGIAILWQGGAGLAAPVIEPIGDPRWMQAVAFDADVEDEILVSNYSTPGPVLTLLDHTGGSWTVTELSVLSFSLFFVATDFNGDDEIDFAVPNPVTNSVEVGLQQSDGSFDIATHTAPTAWTLSTGDMDDDSVPDLVFPGTITILRGDGSGGFLAPITVPGAASTVLIGDVDLDGRDDMAWEGPSGPRIALQGADGTMTTPCDPRLASNEDMALAEITDLDGDGRADPLATGGGSFDVLWGGGAGDASIATTNPPSTTPWGSTVSVTGTLAFGHTCPRLSTGGAAIQLERRSGVGAFEVVSTGASNASGAYALSDQPPTIGTFDYRVRFLGDADHGAATGPVKAVSITQPDDILHVTYAKAAVNVGQNARFTVQLDPFEQTANLDVTLYAKPSGLAEELLGTFSLDPGTGAFTDVLANLTRHTRLRAEWAGDGTWTSSEGVDRISVRAVVVGRLGGPSKKIGQYRVYKVGKNPVFATQVVPAISGKETVTLQRFRNNKWVVMARGIFQSANNGRLVVVVNAAVLGSKNRYRISATHVGNTAVSPGTSPWFSFRVI